MAQEVPASQQPNVGQEQGVTTEDIPASQQPNVEQEQDVMGEDIPASQQPNLEQEERGYHGQETTTEVPQPERQTEVQDQKPSVTEKLLDTQASQEATGVTEHKPGMVAKLRLSFANVKDRVTGHGSHSPTGASPGKHPAQQSPGTVGAGATPSSPGVTEAKARKDLGERIIDKLPGSHSNPYSTGNPVPPPTASDDFDEDEVREKGPGFVGKLMNLVTSQKTGHSTATENATKGTPGTPGKEGYAPPPTPSKAEEGYAQPPTPSKSGDLLDKTKEKLCGLNTADATSEEKWPTPEKPDYHNMPGATHTNEQGKPIEGPTRPIIEDTKKEGLMTKLMDKLHIGKDKSTSPKAGSKDNAQTPT